MNENQDPELLPIDLEIEHTFRRRRRIQKSKREVVVMHAKKGAQQGAAQRVAPLPGVAHDPPVNTAGVAQDRAAQGGVAAKNGQNAVIVADDRDHAIRQYSLPLFNELNLGIVTPEIQAAQFELKPVMFQMLQTVGQFSGMPTEDPHLYLHMFIEVSDSFKLPRVTEDALRLKLFPYSLRDRARAWLNSLLSDFVSTWQEVAERFLMKYFPPTKNAKLRNEITSFQQLDEESLYEAWERFKELLRKFPHHGIPHCIQMETFYNGLNAHTRIVVNASANGALLAKSYNEEYIVKNEAIIQSQAASLRNLENQVGQLANELRNRPHGTLPSDTENPRSIGKEHCKAVTLRNGKELEKDKTESGHEGIPQHCQPASSISKKPPPFPQRFQKQKLDSQFKKFLDMLKQLHINIPLVEALEQMPNYVKFMKDILTRKRRLGEFETVALTKECSSFLQNKLPPKMKDPGSFTIPCTIDRSLAYPDGKIEDVLVKVDKFIFPVDFIVLDYEADREVPIILGRPFLATGRTLIDVQKGELTMRVQNEEMIFNVFKAMRFPDEDEECSVVSVVDSLASKELENNFDDPLERLLMFDSHAEDEDEYLA
ncbi:uncharacterized protein LOC133779647 [Humulus lupulus]|uniref:uncharacterized protein LOC133779647 n=1 Tax=Humulus lupulus TaxID=3486 RepID=UPI002B4138D3|nr:uncharacterized protein LOC133779647 [Humulus lupulus]